MIRFFFLDTNTCIYALKGAYPALGREMAGRAPQTIRVPSLVQAELLYGAEKSRQRKKVLAALGAFLAPLQIVPFCSRSAVHYARIRAELERRGTPIGANDLIIASTVLANHGTLVTHNTGEFGRIDGLAMEDWTS